MLDTLYYICVGVAICASCFVAGYFAMNHFLDR